MPLLYNFDIETTDMEELDRINKNKERKRGSRNEIDK